MSFLGFPIMRYIDINDAEEVIRAIHLTDPSVPIDFSYGTPQDGSSCRPRRSPAP
jgi:hypothetical protein